MKDEPVVEQVRQAREAYAARFNFDVSAICEDLRRLTDQAARDGRAVVPAPPARTRAAAGTTEAAG
jgi:hypothetical protein